MKEFFFFLFRSEEIKNSVLIKIQIFKSNIQTFEGKYRIPLKIPVSESPYNPKRNSRAPRSKLSRFNDRERPI